MRAFVHTCKFVCAYVYVYTFSVDDSTHQKRTTPPKSTLDLESLQLRCKQLQEELEKTRRGWSSDRDHFHLRESKLEASLAAAKKANMELEVGGPFLVTFPFQYHSTKPLIILVLLSCLFVCLLAYLFVCLFVCLF